MSMRIKDPLLATARTMLGLFAAILGLAALAGALCLPFLVIYRTEIAAEMATQGAPGQIVWAMALLILLVGAGCLLGVLFFRNLYRIVGTVGEGDPFVPVNADRLRDMGWIVLAVQIMTLPLMAVTNWMEQHIDNLHAGVSFSLSGLLLALILFILARVFRNGTQMRAELEGTV